MQNEKCYSSVGTAYESAVRQRGKAHVPENEKRAILWLSGRGRQTERQSVFNRVRVQEGPLTLSFAPLIGTLTCAEITLNVTVIVITPELNLGV